LVSYPRDAANTDGVWRVSRRWPEEAPVPEGTVRTVVICDGVGRSEWIPRVTAVSTDDDNDRGAPTDRVFMEAERLVDTNSSLRLQCNTEANAQHSALTNGN